MTHGNAWQTSQDLAGRVHRICTQCGDPYDVEQLVLDKIHDLLLRNEEKYDGQSTDNLIFRARRWAVVDLSRSRKRDGRRLSALYESSERGGESGISLRSSGADLLVPPGDLHCIGHAVCDVLDGLKNYHLSDALLLELLLSPHGQRRLLGRFDDVISEVSTLDEKQRLNALNNRGVFSETPRSESGTEKRKRYTESVERILANRNVSIDEIMMVFSSRDLLTRCRPIVNRIAHTIVRLLQCAWNNTDERVAEFVVFGEAGSHNMTDHLPLLERFLRRDSLLLAATLIDRDILIEAVALLVRDAEDASRLPMTTDEVEDPEIRIERCLRLLRPGAQIAEMNKWFSIHLLGLSLASARDVDRSSRLLNELDAVLPKQCYTRSGLWSAQILTSGNDIEQAYCELEPRLLANGAHPGDFARSWLLRTCVHLLSGVPLGSFRRMIAQDSRFHNSYSRGINHPSSLVQCATLNHIRRMNDVSTLPTDIVLQIQRAHHFSDSPIIRGLCAELLRGAGNHGEPSERLVW